MNVKFHTPKTLKAGSGLSSAKQFLLSLIATTVSIVLTFGTAAVIDHHKNEAAKKEMVMMLISDFDETIEVLQKGDSILSEASRMQQDLAIHPERFDSIRPNLSSVMLLTVEEFSKTAEKIFSTNIETFSTIGNVNFVNEVSSFFITRDRFKEVVQDDLRSVAEGNGIPKSLKAFLEIDIPQYAYLNWTFLQEMQKCRDRCMLMMNVSEKDMEKFTHQQTSKYVNPEHDTLNKQRLEEWRRADSLIIQAKQKLLN